VTNDRISAVYGIAVKKKHKKLHALHVLHGEMCFMVNFCVAVNAYGDFSF